MGDKSPKDRDRKKKQDEAVKKQKKDQAYTKAHPVTGLPVKKGNK